jgi:hairy-and-enhancer-of-split protein
MSFSFFDCFFQADVLELTVKYLRKLKTQNRLGAVDMGPIHPSSSSPVPCPEAADRFKAGFTQCATEVGKCLSTIPGVDVTFGTRLMTYLGHCVNRLEPNTEVPRVPPTMDAPPPPKCPDTPPMSPPAGTAVDLALAAANYRHQLHLHRGRFPVLPHQVSPQSYLLAPAVPMTVDTDDESSEKVWRPW